MECKFFRSLYPEMAMQAAKKVMCHRNVKQTANTEYVQKILTDRKGLIMPIRNEMKSVTEVMVIDTAASDIIRPIRSATGILALVRRQPASITKVSSMPMPEK